ncbi:MAG: hypothetical protein H7144_04935 [Burkholderiales bacterium]|nr:hypothetical protein [Phycisphaerae bacterium]
MTGPKTPEGRARAEANLKPFPAGQSGNPKGRPSAGAAVREWLNAMQDMTRDELDRIFKDEAEPINRRTAAGIWIGASTTGGTDFDRIMDRTDGRPKQSIEIEATPINAERQAMAERLRSDPEAARLALELDRRLRNQTEQTQTNQN